MNDFLAYVRKRRAELKREMIELDTAEAVYRRSGAQMVSAQGTLTITAPVPVSDKIPTIKDMVVMVLAEAGPSGLSALSILDRIRERWQPDLERTTLSPQLSRLKGDGQIMNVARAWKLAEYGTKQPNETGAPADTGAPETGG